MIENSIDLGNGTTLKFAKISAWDFFEVQKELGCSIADADAFKSSVALAWRAAVAGGWDMPFKAFAEVIPIDKISEVVEKAQPFFAMGVASTQEESSDSSGTE